MVTRIERLRDIGVSGENLYEVAWQLAYERLEEYVRAGGGSPMPGNYRSKDGFNLPAWHQVQRNKYRDGELSKLQIDKILATGMPLVLGKSPSEIDAKVKSVKKLNEVRKKQNQKPLIEYEYLRGLLRQNNIRSQSAYQKFKKTLEDRFFVPSHPVKFFKKGESWDILFDKSEFELRPFLEFIEARVLVISMGLKSIKDFKNINWEEMDVKMPTDPSSTYKNVGWNGWDDFLGRKPIIPFLYEEAKNWIKQNDVKNWTEFEKLKSANLLPPEMPKKPADTFKGKG